MPEVDNKLPPAPLGFKWVKNKKFSDEFNGTELDTNIWHQRSPFGNTADHLPHFVTIVYPSRMAICKSKTQY